MRHMKAVWLEEQNLSVRDIARPVPDPQEALVKVRLAGICGTDLELVRGYYPYKGVIGHEFVGEVVAAPDAPGLRGLRVVGEINAACGACAACLDGRRSHCENRTVLGISGRNGAFAEYLVLPVENLHPVPDGLPDEAAVFAEPVAAALEILAQVQVTPMDRVLLVGAGRLGMLIAQVLARTGCTLDVLIRRTVQADLLAAHGIHTLQHEEVAEGSYDLAVEATGSPVGFEIARGAVRPRGTIILKSTYAGQLQVDFSSIVVDEVTLIGSRCGPFQPALEMLEARHVDPLGLIQSEFRLDEALEGFELAKKPGVMKVLLRPGPEPG